MEDGTNIARTRIKPVKVTLDNGTTIYVQARVVKGEEDIVSLSASFEKVTQAIEGIAQSLTAAWEKAKPSRASVEFGVEFAYEAGQVLAMFVDGSTTASMKITLEWGQAASE
jgi:hypothetical protein